MLKAKGYSSQWVSIDKWAVWSGQTIENSNVYSFDEVKVWRQPKMPYGIWYAHQPRVLSGHNLFYFFALPFFPLLLLGVKQLIIRMNFQLACKEVHKYRHLHATFYKNFYSLISRRILSNHLLFKLNDSVKPRADYANINTLSCITINLYCWEQSLPVSIVKDFTNGALAIFS